MKRYIAAIAVWAAAAALFAAINVQAKAGGIVTPDVVGMTVAEAMQAWTDAGFTQLPNVNPGNLDPASVPDAVVVKQTPKAGVVQSANYRGVFFIADTEPAPDPTPDPTPSASPSPSESPSPAPPEEPAPTPSGPPSPTAPPAAAPSGGSGSTPAGEVEGALETKTGGSVAGDATGGAGTLSFTL